MANEYAAVYAAGGVWWLAGGALADRPPAGELGRLYLVKDPGARSWTYDTGAEWISVGASEAAASILQKLLTVDGDGSGLDADLLDGQQGSYYAAAQALIDHAARADNPHSTQHAQTNPVAVDPTSTDTSRNKHLSNADEKANVDHRTAPKPHSEHATLVGGKVPLSEIPDTVVGGLDYQGVWDATTNAPNLTTLQKSKGDYWKVSVAGATSLSGITDWQVGDWVVWNGAAFDKIDNTESVPTVFGRTGNVVAQAGDYTAPQVGAAPSSHVGAGGTAHPNAVANGAAGFMSGGDKGKLDGIAPGGGSPDASTTVKGLSRSSTAPTDPANPVHIESSDPLVAKVGNISTNAREVAGIPGGVSTYVFNNVAPGTAGLVSADVRGTGGVPADARGVFATLYAGPQTAQTQTAVDSADVAASAMGFSPRLAAGTAGAAATSFVVPLGAAGGANAGKIRIAALQGSPTGLIMWITGYYR